MVLSPSTAATQLSGVDPFLIFLTSLEPKKHIEVVRGHEDPNNYYTFIGG